jgi:hypothetical protein
VKPALEHAHACRPDVDIPAYHDAPRDNLWRPTEPLSQALEDDNPASMTDSRGHREPACFDTSLNIARGER